MLVSFRNTRTGIALLQAVFAINPEAKTHPYGDLDDGDRRDARGFFRYWLGEKVLYGIDRISTLNFARIDSIGGTFGAHPTALCAEDLTFAQLVELFGVGTAVTHVVEIAGTTLEFGHDRPVVDGRGASFEECDAFVAEVERQEKLNLTMAGHSVEFAGACTIGCYNFDRDDVLELVEAYREAYPDRLKNEAKS